MYTKTDRLYCFSPPVMIATFLIELSLAVYTVVRYKLSAAVRLVTAILVLLAIFQLAEYNVCGRSSAATMLWSRIGYIAITLLPALALHLVLVISHRKYGLLRLLAYGTGLIFATVLGFSHAAFNSYVCAGNYAIFQLAHPIGGLFFAYYYTWLVIGIALGLWLSIQAKKSIRQALVFQVAGYLSFILPTGIVNALNPKTINGIPSVMCGFAVIYALMLTLGIVPLAAQTKKS